MVLANHIVAHLSVNQSQLNKTAVLELIYICLLEKKTQHRHHTVQWMTHTFNNRKDATTSSSN